MKNYRKVISVIAVLIGLFVMSVSVSAADLAIIVVDGKAVVGNGTSGVAIVASYDEDGKLTKVVKEYVTESSSTVLNVKKRRQGYVLGRIRNNEPAFRCRYGNRCHFGRR